MVSVVKTTKDGGEAAATAAAAAATTATPTTLPRRHGDPMSNWSGREGGRLLQDLFTASSTSEFGLRQRAL